MNIERFLKESILAEKDNLSLNLGIWIFVLKLLKKLE